MFSPEIIGAWIVVLLTLCIGSFLYDDNPFYKAAEHLYVGISAGYTLVIAFWTQVHQQLLGRLWPQIPENTGHSFLHVIWYWIYEAFNFLTTGFGLLDRSVFPENGIKGHDEIQLLYVIYEHIYIKVT